MMKENKMKCLKKGEKRMKRHKKISLLAVMFVIGSSLMTLQPLHAHCQIPCGIYDDYARVKSMSEDAVTIEKSIRLMVELVNKTDVQSRNQFVRWVMNKEKHAENIISTISNYFLTQRVKLSQEDYADRLKKHHAVILAAMKVKQNTDEKYVKKLRDSIEALLAFYPKHEH